MKTSKEEILIVALELFSKQGYKNTSIYDLAGKVGIKSASLYNHFKNKEDILNNVVIEAKKRYLEKREKINVPDNADKAVSAKYNEMTREHFLFICEELFKFYVTDPFSSNLRKFLCIEQFSNPTLGILYKEYFIDNIIDSQSTAFGDFVNHGKFRNENPQIIALHFYAPIFLLFTAYDNGMPLEEALAKVRQHAIAFSKNYSMNFDEEKGF